MPFDFILKQTKPDVVKDFMVVRGRQIPLDVVRNHRARRYRALFDPPDSDAMYFPAQTRQQCCTDFVCNDSASVL